MRLAVLRETDPDEQRVALAPAHIKKLVEAGWDVRVEASAGRGSGWDDAAYAEAGATVQPDRAATLAEATCIVKVRPPRLAPDDETDLLPSGAVLISFLSPGPEGVVPALAARGVSAMAMERIPRTTRAQRMDALSSQATAAGYRAALLAATHLPRFYPMLTTAAGTMRPANVLVLGAGVAGLQAIATSKRLGAVVQGYDIRPAAAEQVRSLGATFLDEEDEGAMEGTEDEGGYARALGESEQERQLAFLGRHVPKADAVITTAQIPGRPAPRLITRKMVEAMAPGSVVVDLAGETGGNCEASIPGQVVRVGDTTVLAPLDLPSGVAQHASLMFGTNVSALLDLLVTDGAFGLDLSDDIVDAVLVAHDGHVRTPAGGG